VEKEYTREEMIELYKESLEKYADLFRRLEERDKGETTFD